MPLPADYVNSDGVSVRGINRRLSRLFHQTWTNPVAAVANGIKTTFAGPNAATVVYTPASGFNGSLVSGGRCVLDFPRNVVIVVTHATAVVAESGVITGLDEYNRVITEAWSVTAGTASKTFTGKKAFKAVTSVSVTAATDASANSNVIGTGVVLGLQINCSIASAVKEVVDGAIVTTGTLVKSSSASMDDARGTYAPVTAPDGAHDYEVAYITDDPEAS